MKNLTLLDNNFISIAYAEERIFNPLSKTGFISNWSRGWTEISFAESGELSLVNRSQEKVDKPVVNRCEIGDASCFMKRNS